MTRCLNRSAGTKPLNVAFVSKLQVQLLFVMLQSLKSRLRHLAILAFLSPSPTGPPRVFRKVIMGLHFLSRFAGEQPAHLAGRLVSFRFAAFRQCGPQYGPQYFPLVPVLVI